MAAEAAGGTKPGIIRPNFINMSIQLTQIYRFHFVATTSSKILLKEALDKHLCSKTDVEVTHLFAFTNEEASHFCFYFVIDT